MEVWLPFPPATPSLSISRSPAASPQPAVTYRRHSVCVWWGCVWCALVMEIRLPLFSAHQRCRIKTINYGSNEAFGFLFFFLSYSEPVLPWCCLLLVGGMSPGNGTRPGDIESFVISGYMKSSSDPFPISNQTILCRLSKDLKVILHIFS